MQNLNFQNSEIEKLQEARAREVSLPADLYPHQRAAVEKFAKLNSIALLQDMGTGKTRATIESLRASRILRSNFTALILCPLSVRWAWKRQFEKFWPQVAHAVRIVDGTGAERARIISESLAPLGSPQIFALNHESLALPVVQKALFEKRFDVVIVDEAHKYKNPNSKRSKALTRIVDAARFRFALTGSPVLNKPFDIFMTMRALGAHVLGDNFYFFRKRFFRDKNEWRKARAGMQRPAAFAAIDDEVPYWPDFKIRPEREPELKAIIAKYSVQVSKAEALPFLPKLVRKEVFVELAPGARREYRELCAGILREKEFGSEVAHAINALTKTLRLQQLVSGINAAGEKVECAKYDALKDLLEELLPREKVVIWTCWRGTYGAIADIVDSLGAKFASMTGDDTPAEREAALRDFQSDERVRVLIANPACAGTGVDGLQHAASTMVYFAKSYNLEHDIQSEARLHRSGAEVHQSVTRIDILTRGTIDEVIDEALRAKLSAAQMLLSLESFLYGTKND